MKLFTVVFIISEVIMCISTKTHWVVSDDGKIQSKMNSIFLIKQPDDLLTFLEQEKRKEDAQMLYERIVATKSSIDSQWAQIGLFTNIESIFYTADPNCQMVDIERTNINLYASIATDGSFRQGITSKDFMLKDDLVEFKSEVPDCENTFPLDFSMYTFDHLQAMRNRKNLSQHQEKELIQYLSPGMSISKFASYIAYGLMKNKTSWLHLNLGAIYWRYKGDSYKALECSRRAIIMAPRQYRDIPLLTTGGILHAAGHSAEAAIVLHTAINYAPDQSRQHLALGNIYATLGDYKRSIACYDNCLKLSPNMEQARAAKHAVLCHQKIEETLVLLHSQLQGILTDLQTYDKEQEAWLKLTELIFKDKDTQHQYLESLEDWPLVFVNGPAQTCTQVDGDSQILSCEVAPRSHMLPPNLQIDVGVNLQMLKNIEKQARKINQQIATSIFLHGLNDENQKSKKLKRNKPKSFELFLDPDEKADDKVDAVEDFESEDWPTQANCRKYKSVTDTKIYIPIFLSTDLLSQVFSDNRILLNKDKFSSWDPPVCETAENSHNYFTSMLLQLLKMTTAKYIENPDADLISTLTLLVNHKDIDEIGKRISVAMRSNLEDSWVVYLISSLYWRVKGQFYEALTCAQSALDSAPSEMKNVPLVNIASILHRFKRFDEATAVIVQALNVDPDEPISNFLYGFLLHVTGRSEGAITYFQRAIRNNLHSLNEKAAFTLRTIVCDAKFGSFRNVL